MPPRSRRNCTVPATASCSATCTATSRAGHRTCPATTVHARSSMCSPACATAPARAHRHRGQGHAGHAGTGTVPLVRSAGPGRARPEDRLRPLVGAGPDHHPGRACHRHRRSLGRQADRDPARYRRTARGAGAGPRCPRTHAQRTPASATGARAPGGIGAGQGTGRRQHPGRQPGQPRPTPSSSPWRRRGWWLCGPRQQQSPPQA